MSWLPELVAGVVVSSVVLIGVKRSLGNMTLTVLWLGGLFVIFILAAFSSLGPTSHTKPVAVWLLMLLGMRGLTQTKRKIGLSLLAGVLLLDFLRSGMEEVEHSPSLLFPLLTFISTLLIVCGYFGIILLALDMWPTRTRELP